MAVAVAAAGCGDDGGGGSSGRQQQPALLRVTSAAFVNRTRLPKQYTCDGEGDEPPVQAGASPIGTSELVLVMSDLDAAGGTFVHVTRYGLSPHGKALVSEGGREGDNSKGTIGWTPPCPPAGGGQHRYVWTVYAVGDPIDLDAGAKPDAVRRALSDDDVLAQGTIEALYSR
jgi:phosphatidylethanolamine-binding protein (PEBP) family uncharacterized protein